MSEQLKPCPFCGHEAKLIENDGGFEWSIYCKECYAEMNTNDSQNKNALIKNWNDRCKK